MGAVEVVPSIFEGDRELLLMLRPGGGGRGLAVGLSQAARALT